MLFAKLSPAGRAALSFLPQPMAFGVVKDAVHDGPNAVHCPPGIECCVQPILDGLRLDFIQAERAPSRHDVSAEIKRLLLTCRSGDLVLAPEISILVHPCHSEKEG